MSENLTSNNLENDQFKDNAAESDYQKLITRLKEISDTLALVEKKYSDKI